MGRSGGRGSNAGGSAAGGRKSVRSGTTAGSSWNRPSGPRPRHVLRNSPATQRTPGLPSVFADFDSRQMPLAEPSEQSTGTVDSHFASDWQPVGGRDFASQDDGAVVFAQQLGSPVGDESSGEQQDFFFGGEGRD